MIGFEGVRVPGGSFEACYKGSIRGEFRKLGVPGFGVVLLRILLFRELCLGVSGA